MWGQISGTTFTLYRRSGLAAGDAVCSGTISSGSVTLTASNSSGITGSCDVTYTSTSLFDVIVSYADEQDIATLYSGWANELDSNSKYQGLLVRFEAPLIEQKRFLDNMLWSRLEDAIGTDNQGRPAIGRIADPRQFARVHAWLVIAQFHDLRGPRNTESRDAAKAARAQAIEEFNLIRPLLDSNRDAIVDDIARVGSIVVRRA